MEPAGPAPLLVRLVQIEQLIIEVLADVYTAARDPALLLSPDAFCDPGGSAPGSKAAHSGAKALASGLRVLRTSYELLSTGRTCTYREFYYLHAEFFGNQLEANAAVLAVGARLGLLRHELGFLAAPRGWFMGPVAVDVVSPGTAAGCDDSGPCAPHKSASARALGLDHFSQHGPRSVPPAAVSHPVRIVNHGANFILVVEKECIFRRLVEDGFWRGEGGGGLGPCLLLTGCGFPDLATRALLWHIHDALPHVPIFGLSDWNPYGMAIMMCYRFGSKTTPEANRFIVPLEWIGLRAGDVSSFSLSASSLQTLTAADEAKASSLARDPAVAADASLAAEASRFLVGEGGGRRVKMEVEGVLGRGMGFLGGTYLPRKIRAAAAAATGAGAGAGATASGSCSP